MNVEYSKDFEKSVKKLVLRLPPFPPATKKGNHYDSLFFMPIYQQNTECETYRLSNSLINLPSSEYV